MQARLWSFARLSDRTFVTGRSADVVRVWKRTRIDPVIIGFARRVGADSRGNSQ
jgi:hypothetical protein